MTNSAHTQAPTTALEKGYAIVNALTKISQTHNSSISAVALAWIRANKEVSIPIASARTVEKLHEIVPIVQLTAYEVASLSECQQKL